MTTIIGIKIKEGVLLSGDSQITYGNVKMPFSYPKIQSISSCLVGGSGSVGNLQQVLNRCMKNIFISKILAEDFSYTLSPKVLARELASINFELPLEYKDFNPFSFLIAGAEAGEGFLFNVGDDGSNVEIPNYFSIGSGFQLALSLLNEQYDFNMSKEEAITMLYLIFGEITKSEVYTNNMINIMLVSNEGVVSECLPAEENPTQTLDEKNTEKEE